MLKVGLIGYGYWGPNLARNFSQNSGCQLFAIADRDAKRRKSASAAYGNCRIVSSAETLLNSPDIDIIAIATPLKTHYDLTMKALQNGKHVFVEKPLADSAKKAEKIIDYAKKQKKIVMVDHTFLFTGALLKIKQMIQRGQLGKILYYDSIRVNLGLFQHDTDVIWDLAVHDLAIMDFLIPNEIESVQASGSNHYHSRFIDVGYLTVKYKGSMIAHLNVNWLSPVKIRQTIIGGDKKMVVWNHLEPEEPLKIYDKGVKVTTKLGTYKTLPQYRIGPMHAPVVERSEALQNEIAYFVSCIKKSVNPHNDARAGLRVVKILEAASRSLKNNGRAIAL